jgi:hypothetical protein
MAEKSSVYWILLSSNDSVDGSKIKCSLCQRRRQPIVNLPCMHVRFCRHCFISTDQCVVCRVAIEGNWILAKKTLTKPLSIVVPPDSPWSLRTCNSPELPSSP